MDTEYYAQYPPGMKMTDGVPEDVRISSARNTDKVLNNWHGLGDGSRQLPLESVRPSQPSDSSLLWSSVLLSLDHVIPWKRMRHLHLLEDEKSQNTCNEQSSIKFSIFI